MAEEIMISTGGAGPGCHAQCRNAAFVEDGMSMLGLTKRHDTQKKKA
jgi:hypothetical protein